MNFHEMIDFRNSTKVSILQGLKPFKVALEQKIEESRKF